MRHIMAFIIFFSPILTAWANSNCIKFGIIPYAEVNDIKNDYKAWLSYIEEKTGRCIDLYTSKDYGEIAKDFNEDSVDCARVGPFLYVLINKNKEVDPLVIGVKKDGEAFYRSIAVMNGAKAKELGITSPLKGQAGMNTLASKLKDKKDNLVISFTDTGSTSGYAVPLYYMKEAGMDGTKEFRQTIFAGTHDSSLLTVANGIADISVANDKSYDKLYKKGDITKESNVIVWISDDIPESPIVCKADMDKKWQKNFQDALLSMPSSAIPKHGQISKYEKADKKQYEIVEKIDAYLEK